MAAPMDNVFVGTEIGLLKGFSLAKNSWKNINAVESAKRENEICAMCWNNSKETEIVTGLKSNKIVIYDVKNVCDVKVTVKNLDFGEGKLRNICQFEDRLSSAVSSGTVRLWDGEDLQEEIEAGKDLFCMSRKKDTENIFSVGGKENDLKLFDWNNTKCPVFQAKNVRNDWLNLRVPVWVMQTRFIPSTDNIVTSTGYHQIRLYDTKVQRRPVLETNFGEYPITALSINNSNHNQIIVGNTHGQMALLDIRKGAMVQEYRGFAGGIRDIQCHDKKPLIVSCGADRFLRIHDLNSKEMLHKVYMKSKLNCFLLTKTNWDINGTECVDEGETEENFENEDDGSVDDEDIWTAMEIVKTKTKRKQEAVHTESKRMKDNTDVVEKTLDNKSKKKKKTSGKGRQI